MIIVQKALIIIYFKISLYKIYTKRYIYKILIIINMYVHIYVCMYMEMILISGTNI